MATTQAATTTAERTMPKKKKQRGEEEKIHQNAVVPQGREKEGEEGEGKKKTHTPHMSQPAHF